MRTVKNLFEDILQHFKNKLFSSKYVVKGKCKMCGKCCSSILLSDKNGYIKDEEVFFEAQKKNKAYLKFYPNGKVDDKEGESLCGAILFKCKLLREDNKCGFYFFRPIFCRDYPAINRDFIYAGGETLDGCGFYFDVDKKFKSYLEN